MISFQMKMKNLKSKQNNEDILLIVPDKFLTPEIEPFTQLLLRETDLLNK